MKRKLIFALAALIISICCLPLFSGCSVDVIYTLNEDEGGKYYTVNCSGYSSSLSGSFEIPEYYGEGEDRAPVREIAHEGFAGTGISSVTIPSTVTKIGNAAFAHCANLKSVKIEGASLEEISRGCFGDCGNLSKISIPASVKSIGIMAFAYCYALGDITLPEGLETIELKAFYYAGLTKIVIPDSVHDIVLPDLDENGEQKTDDKGNLLTLVTPAIGIAAFHSCLRLQLAVVGKGVTALKAGTFGYCPALKEVYLPASLIKIEGAHYADGSEEIKYDKGEFYCGHAFHSDEALTDVYFGGTASEWGVLSERIDNDVLNRSGAILDNSAVLDAMHHFGAEYKEN